MAAGDEVTLGELDRNIRALVRSVEILSSRMITTDVWSTERQMIDLRLNVVTENTTALVAALEKERTERIAEREKDRLEAKADRDRVQSFRRSIVFAVMTSVIAPIVVALLLLIVKPGGS